MFSQEDRFLSSAQEELPELPWGCTWSGKRLQIPEKGAVRRSASVHSRGNLPDIINSGLVHLCQGNLEA